MTKVLSKYSTENPQIGILTEVGLSQHEAQTYLAGLRLGPTTVLKLSRETGIKRTTLYSVVEDLKRKGLFRVEVKGLKHLLAAESPENLSRVLERKAHDFKQSISVLTSMYTDRAHGGSDITYHEGVESIKSVYESLIREGSLSDPYLAISSEDFFAYDKAYFLDFVTRRARARRNVRLILVDSQNTREEKKYERNFNEQIRFLPPRTMIDVNVVITKDALVLHQLKAPVHALVIKTKTIIDMQRNIFEILWNTLD